MEMTIVVATVGILAAVAIPAYRHFTKRAQSVEAEVALTEIHRLQQLHRAQSGSFAGDLWAVGFNPIHPLKFYSVGMRFLGGAEGIAYQAYASAKEDSEGSTRFVLTQYQDGHVTMDKSIASGPAALPEVGGSVGSKAGDGGGLGDNALAGAGTGASSSSSTSSGQRTVMHSNQSIGMDSK